MVETHFFFFCLFNDVLARRLNPLAWGTENISLRYSTVSKTQTWFGNFREFRTCSPTMPTTVTGRFFSCVCVFSFHGHSGTPFEPTHESNGEHKPKKQYPKQTPNLLRKLSRSSTCLTGKLFSNHCNFYLTDQTWFLFLSLFYKCSARQSSPLMERIKNASPSNSTKNDFPTV